MIEVNSYAENKLFQTIARYIGFILFQETSVSFFLLAAKK